MTQPDSTASNTAGSQQSFLAPAKILIALMCLWPTATITAALWPIFTITDITDTSTNPKTTNYTETDNIDGWVTGINITDNTHSGTFTNNGILSLNFNYYHTGTGVTFNLYGIHTTQSTIEINNTAAITLTASTTNVASTTVSAFGIWAAGDITNTGAITVTATDGLAGTYAYGIYLSGSSTLDSQGLINVLAADGAYQVYADGGNVSITGYAMEFGGTQGDLNTTYTSCMGTVNSGTISFNNATLYVHTANDFVDGSTYDIPTLVEGAGISDQFTTASTATTSPDYSAILTSGGGSTHQKITINYDPQASTPQQATAVKQQIVAKSVNIVKQNLLTSLLNQTGPEHSNAVASTNPSMGLLTKEQTEANERSVFLLPYYSHASEKSDPMGYDADIYGFSGGVNYRLDEMSIVGFHGGYGYANVDYTGNGYDQRNEKLDVYSAGLHGICRTNDDWVLSGTSTFFYSSNDYHDHTSTNRETADYETLGIETNLSLGYLFKTDCGLIVPEIGLTHLWQHRGAYTTDNLDNADVTHGQMDDNEVYAKLGVTWYGDYHYDQWQLIPSLGIGLEQTLTDGEISNTMTAGTAVETVSDEQDRTAAKLTAGLEFIRNNTSLLAGYSGSYSSNFSESSFYLRLKHDF